MKKEILLFWFGDLIPSYAAWNIENIKSMNPTWEVKFINYSKSQVLSHESIGDWRLTHAVLEARKKGQTAMTQIVDEYKIKYLNDFSGGIVVYMDLDCFPIAPLDDFFVSESHGHSFLTPSFTDSRGYWINNENSLSGKDIKLPVRDLWLTYKIDNDNLDKKVFFKDYLIWQILKDVDLSKQITYYDQFLVNDGNKEQVQLIEERKSLFSACKLVGSMCNNHFSPIEHYHFIERAIENNI